MRNSLQRSLRSQQRVLIVALGVSLICLVLVFSSVTSLNKQFLSSWTHTRWELRRTDNGHQFRFLLAIHRVPRRLRRLLDLRVGDARDGLGVWAYHDGYAIYLRLGARLLNPRKVGCLTEYRPDDPSLRGLEPCP